MHVNKISIICCWFFDEHGHFFFFKYYFSFVVFDLNSDIFFFNVSMLLFIGLFDRFTEYLIKNRICLIAVIGNWSRMEFFFLFSLSSGALLTHYWWEITVCWSEWKLISKFPWNQNAYRIVTAPTQGCSFVSFNVKSKETFTSKVWQLDAIF